MAPTPKTAAVSPSPAQGGPQPIQTIGRGQVAPHYQFAAPQHRRLGEELFHAAAWGKGEELERILMDPAARALCRFTEDNGNIPLMLAASGVSEQSFHCVRLLLPFSDPLAMNRSGQGVIHIAVMHGSKRALDALLPLCDPNQRGFRGITPLMLSATSRASAQEAFECAQALLARGADPLLTSDNGMSALMHAAASHQSEDGRLLRLLLPISDLDAKDDRGRNARAHARLNRRTSAAELLIQTGRQRRARASISRVVEQAAGSLTPGLVPKKLRI